METKQFFVMVRTKDEPGAGVYKAYVNADNIHNATYQARAMFGNLLLSESAIPVPENVSWNG
jgi:hypothetical protein